VARTILIFAVIALGAIYLFARFVRRASMFYPERYPSGAWDTRMLPVQPRDHYFTTSDGVRLHGWLFAATSPEAPLMIWFHGNGGNVTERGTICATLATRGISVFIFDWRGYGRSEGSASESGLYRDGLAAYDYAHKTFEARSIAVYGESLGGPYAAYVASERKTHSAIIENSFPSMLALGNALYAPIPLGLTAPRAMRTADWLNDAGRPVLVMHGKNDGVIPFRLGVALYDKLRVQKEMLVSETAGHCEIPAVEPARYYEAVTRWVRRE
jgi:fermentation-respiration switch protein FrsA (DUF1100 family)